MSQLDDDVDRAGDATAPDTATHPSDPAQSNPPPATSKSGNEPRVRVHDARLYTELLDACDWSVVLRRERHARRRELLSLHHEEEAKLRAQRDALQRKARADADALCAAHAKRNAALRAEREEALFQRRMADFFSRHRRLLEQWAPLERSLNEHQARVREQIYDLWERDVFLPIQREICRKVNAKCASDTRPHHHTARDWDVLRTTVTNPLPNDIQTDLSSGRVGVQLGEKMTWSHTTSTPSALTWKERKDWLWRSFLAESNRLARAHPRGGVALEVVDAVEYDPVAQRVADTIYYHARHAPLSSVDAQRWAARRMEEDYTKLALAYRDAARRSRTGALNTPPDASTTAAAESGTPADLHLQLAEGVRELRRKWTLAMDSRDADAAAPTQEVMPLPLNVNPAELDNPSSRLLPWMDLPTVCTARPREATLSVEDWGSRRLKDTVYGRYVDSSGAQLPSCARRTRDGAYMVASSVVFDHFNFPREAEPPHFGKRMY